MKSTSIANYLLPRARDILFLLVFAAAIAAGWRTLNNDGDLPRHLLMGRVIVETHAIPRQEMFSYVYEGRPYVAHEWLADVIFYLSYLALGLKGVVLLTALLIAGAFYVLYSALSSEFNERILMLVIILWGVAITFPFWVARPLLFSIFFLAVWLVLTDRISRGRQVNFWLLPGLMVLWGNIHAEFVAGFLVLLAYMAGWFWDYLFNRENLDRQVIKKLAGTFAVSLAASLINPFGWNTWKTILGYMGNKYLMSTIFETRPPDFSSPSFLVELLFIIASILIFALKKGGVRSGQAFLIAGFTVLAMTSSRNMHLYGVVAPFVLAGPAIEIADLAFLKRSASAMLQIEKRLKGLVWPAATLLVTFVLLVSGKLGGDYFIDPKLFPVGAVQWLQDNPQSGHMFDNFIWGGYIVWRLWPEQKDFIDSQSDLTGEATKLYLTVNRLDTGWQAVLQQYDVQWVIMPVDSALSLELAKDGWRTLYKDSTAIILRQD
jgi:hypothetical protein